MTACSGTWVKSAEKMSLWCSWLEGILGMLGTLLSPLELDVKRLPESQVVQSNVDPYNGERHIF